MSEEVNNNENMSLSDMLFDEDNSQNLMLYDPDGNEVEVEQVAVIPMDGVVYCLVHPIVPLEGMTEDEALVLELAEDPETGDDMLNMVTDDDIIDRVFEEYYDLCRQEGIAVEEDDKK